MTERYSEILKQNIKIYEDGILCDDMTAYNREELDLIRGQSVEMKRGLHKLKKIFDGEVVE